MSKLSQVGLITGATQGIGRAAAMAIAKSGMKLILVARDAERGAATVAAVKAHSGNANIALMLADLSVQAEVQRLADAVLAEHPALQLLVNNAGAVFEARSVTDDGLEKTFALNHMAYFLLTQRLMSALRAGAPARIINVASDAHKFGRINLDDLQNSRAYRGASVYAQSKLANILFTFELARRLEGSGVTANCLHPGVVSTGFALNNSGFFRTFYRLLGPFMRTPEKGAATVVHLALSPAVAHVSGQYFANSRPARATATCHNRDLQAGLWRKSEELVVH